MGNRPEDPVWLLEPELEPRPLNRPRLDVVGLNAEVLDGVNWDVVGAASKLAFSLSTTM